MKQHQSISRKHQQGVALIICLIVLLIMTIIGVSATQTTTLEERMAGNLRNSNLAFQAAETALRIGENKLSEISLPGGPTIDGSSGYWDLPDNTSTVLGDTWWWDQEANPLGLWKKTPVATDGTNGVFEVDLSSSQLSGITTNPRYVLEKVAEVPDTLRFGGGGYSGEPPPTTFTRVTARAEAGANGESIVYLQSVFARPYVPK
jgi:type IV pilus assembly protein PilX